MSENDDTKIDYAKYMKYIYAPLFLTAFSFFVAFVLKKSDIKTLLIVSLLISVAINGVLYTQTPKTEEINTTNTTDTTETQAS